jgi:hypothetical protein
LRRRQLHEPRVVGRPAAQVVFGQHGQISAL